jgi:hypothetical protein
MATQKELSISPTMEYKHAPLNHDKPSVRLMQVLPDLSTGGLVQCRISQHVLPIARSECSKESPDEIERGLEDYNNDMPAYMCLSYTWGDPQDEINVIVDGRTFSIRRNLFDFLAIARRTLAYAWLWIDALCIDQSNTLERNHQVLQMGRIYDGAAMVLVWLGNDKGAESVLHDVNQASLESNSAFYEGAVQHAILWNSRPLLDYDLPVLRVRELSNLATDTDSTFNFLKDTTGGKVEKCFEDLMENEYWSRAWVSFSHIENRLGQMLSSRTYR